MESDVSGTAHGAAQEQQRGRPRRVSIRAGLQERRGRAEGRGQAEQSPARRRHITGIPLLSASKPFDIQHAQAVMVPEPLF